MATINYAVTLYEGQTYTVVFPAPPGGAYNVIVYRHAWNLADGLTADIFSDYTPTSLSGPVTGTSQNVVTKTDGVIEGNEYFQYVYDMSWQTGDYATYGGDKHIWTFTLRDAKNRTPRARTGSPTSCTAPTRLPSTTPSSRGSCLRR